MERANSTESPWPGLFTEFSQTGAVGKPPERGKKPSRQGISPNVTKGLDPGSVTPICKRWKISGLSAGNSCGTAGAWDQLIEAS